MRTSNYLLSTLKESPSDAEVISHQLMLRAGLIRKVASGLYTWLPTGLRVLNKVAAIVREEMNRAGAVEILMPGVQPADLWEETGRWGQFGPELLRIKDRHDRPFCLGPTHEEIVTDLLRKEASSYKQLPINVYQIQTKFRDEVRPRFGVMRAREFLMKDAYSFHISEDCLSKTYDTMYQTYSIIFDRIGLEYRAVLADTGSIGGSRSHEFHVLADSGEDDIVFTNKSDYAANVEMASCPLPQNQSAEATQSIEKVATPNARTIEEVSAQLDLPASAIVKTLVVHAESDDDSVKLIALVIRGDHALNEIKASKVAGVKSPLTFATEAEIIEATGCAPGSIGPFQLDLPLVVDPYVLAMPAMVCGANEDGYHLTGVNWQRDIADAQIADIRDILPGELSPVDGGEVQIRRGIEVGHIFALGKKYSEAMKASVLNENGKAVTMTMGCYGIGVSRIVAAAIEQNNDDNGIVWPQSIAPFTVAIVPMNMGKSDRVRREAEGLYQSLVSLGVDVLLDDRNERPGIMFKDIELIGIPHRITIGERSLDKGEVEYFNRASGKKTEICARTILEFMMETIKKSEKANS